MAKKKSSKKKGNFARIGQYLIAKSGTKYIKLDAGPKADKETKALIKKVVAALGSDVLFVNIFDDDFREKYNIPDFNKGSISVNLDSEEQDDSDDEDDDDESEDDDDESEDEDDDSDDDEEDDEDEKSSKKKPSKKKKKKSSDDEDDDDESDF